MIVYTASHQNYADSILDHLDKNREIFKYRLYRHNCFKHMVEGKPHYVKDLRIFNGIPLKDIVIIDNSILSFAFQLNNGIPILPFYDNKEDKELECLEQFLDMLSDHDDVRTIIASAFKLQSRVESSEEDSNFKEDYDQSFYVSNSIVNESD